MITPYFRIHGDTEWIKKTWCRNIFVKHADITPPDLKRITYDNNFTNGVIDYTGEYYPETYENRTITLECRYGSIRNCTEYINQLVNSIHGETIDVSLDKGKTWYTGVSSISDFNGLEFFGDFTITIDANPFIFSVDDTTRHYIPCIKKSDNMFNKDSYEVVYDTTNKDFSSLVPEDSISCVGPLGTRKVFKIPATKNSVYTFFGISKNCNYLLTDSSWETKYSQEFIPKEDYFYLHIMPFGPLATLSSIVFVNKESFKIDAGVSATEITFPIVEEKVIVCMNDKKFQLPIGGTEYYKSMLNRGINIINVYSAESDVSGMYVDYQVRRF